MTGFLSLLTFKYCDWFWIAVYGFCLIHCYNIYYMECFVKSIITVAQDSTFLILFSCFYFKWKSFWLVRGTILKWVKCCSFLSCSLACHGDMLNLSEFNVALETVRLFSIQQDDKESCSTGCHQLLTQKNFNKFSDTIHVSCTLLQLVLVTFITYVRDLIAGRILLLVVFVRNIIWIPAMA